MSLNVLMLLFSSFSWFFLLFFLYSFSSPPLLSCRNSLPIPDMGDIFGNMMIGIMEGHEETSTFQWFTNLLQHFTKHYESLQASAELYKTYASKPYKNLTFKVFFCCMLLHVVVCCCMLLLYVRGVCRVELGIFEN